MSRVEAAPGDRLPWLPDEPERPTARRRGNAVLASATVAIAFAAAAGLWIAGRTLDAPTVTSRRPAPATTVRLPPPQAARLPTVRIAAQPDVRPSPQPVLLPAPVRDMSVPPAPGGRARPQTDAALTRETLDPTPVARPVPAAPPTGLVMPKPSDPRIFSGAAGRVVQIGAFGSVRQAKLGWRYMAQAYPAMSGLPALVRPARNSKGRTFYRFQVGTTSQAHSEVLCQRMERIRFSCAVVGLPWKAKVER